MDNCFQLLPLTSLFRLISSYPPRSQVTSKSVLETLTASIKGAKSDISEMRRALAEQEPEPGGGIAFLGRLCEHHALAAF